MYQVAVYVPTISGIYVLRYSISDDFRDICTSYSIYDVSGIYVLVTVYPTISGIYVLSYSSPDDFRDKYTKLQ